MTDLARNKTNVVAFYELMFNACSPRDAVDRYVGDSYTQHNPHVADGKDGFIEYFERMKRDWPGRHVEIKRVVAREISSFCIAFNTGRAARITRPLIFFASMKTARSLSTGMYCRSYPTPPRTRMECFDHAAFTCVSIGELR